MTDAGTAPAEKKETAIDVNSAVDKYVKHARTKTALEMNKLVSGATAKKAAPRRARQNQRAQARKQKWEDENS